MLSVISTLLWVALAGFILGFAASTVWEWFYFRGRRLAVSDGSLQVARVRELEAEIEQKDGLIRQLQTAHSSLTHTNIQTSAEQTNLGQTSLSESSLANTEQAIAGAPEPRSAQPIRVADVGPAAFPAVDVDAPLQSTPLRGTSLPGSPIPSAVTAASSLAEAPMASLGIDDTTVNTPAYESSLTSLDSDSSSAGLSSVGSSSVGSSSEESDQPMISFRRGPARRTRASSSARRPSALDSASSQRTSPTSASSQTGPTGSLPIQPMNSQADSGPSASGPSASGPSTRRVRTPHQSLGGSTFSRRPLQSAAQQESTVDNGDDEEDRAFQSRLAKEFEDREKQRVARISEGLTADGLAADGLTNGGSAEGDAEPQDQTEVAPSSAVDAVEAKTSEARSSEARPTEAKTTSFRDETVLDSALEAEPFEPDAVDSGLVDTRTSNTNEATRVESDTVVEKTVIAAPTRGEETSAGSTAVDSKTAEPTGRASDELSPHYPDDLTLIKGIGRSSQRKLYKEGICTWHELMVADPKQIGKVMRTRDEEKIAGWQAQAQEFAQENDRVGQIYDGPTPDDLEDIEGLTPTAMRRLYQEGIVTFRRLSKSRPNLIGHLFEDMPNVQPDDVLKWIHRAQEIDYRGND